MRKKILVSLCGYNIGMKKTAVCFAGGGSFSVIDLSDGSTAFSGVLVPMPEDPESGDSGCLADFSRLDKAGTYCIKCGFHRSEEFVIGERVYDELKDTLLTGIYLNRCGYDLTADDDNSDYGEYFHKSCHTEYVPHYFSEESNDVSGGWHCAGGYGKYVSVTAVTCAYLMYSFLLYPDSFSEIKNGLPLILDECRWGLEWLLKMQAPDGGVYHKCDAAVNIYSSAYPCDDNNDYYVFPESADAAMYFTAITALGARVFESFDRRFSRKLSRAAANSWLWIANFPVYERWEIPSGAEPHSIGDTSPEDYCSVYMWAVSEMFSLTGDEVFRRRLDDMIYYNDTAVFTLTGTGGFAALAYITGAGVKQPHLEFYLKKKLGDRADKFVSAASDSCYGVALNAIPKHKGYGNNSNLTVLSDCIVCQTAYILFGLKKYLDAAAGMMHYILGLNPMGMCYVTGTSKNSPMHPCHAASMASYSSPPVPGMAVSGANYYRSDKFSKWKLGKNTAPAKCYIDNECSSSTNEASVCFTAAAVMAAAFFGCSDSDVLKETSV